MSDAEVDAIAAAVPVSHFPRGTMLIRQGEPAPECFFVLEGCIRLYYLDDDGGEHTVDFFVEEQSLTVFESYRSGAPSPYSAECVEDVLALAGDVKRERVSVEAVANVGVVTRRGMEAEFGDHQRALGAFKALRPEERYQWVLSNRPGLAARVAQAHLASYLGVTPESLSRIKMRLLKKSRGRSDGGVGGTGSA